MAYAKEYIEKYYPTHEVVYAVLKYRYVSDGIENYAVHLLINRSDLSNGKRMNEGRADAVAKMHANRIRAMDMSWGLRQVRNGAANSQIHAKQPPRYTTKEVGNEQDASE